MNVKQLAVNSFVTACALILLGAGCLRPDVRPAGTIHELSLQSASAIDADQFVVPELFDKGWNGPLVSKLDCETFRAGVVNHHALASDLLAGFFATLKRCRSDAKTFIILSPDHYVASPSSVATHGRGYRFAGKDIATDVDAFARLHETLPFATDQPQLFEREHGVGALIPFLAHEFPDARVVPVVVRQAIRPDESAVLSRWVMEELKQPETFIIVSADMSHYLSEQRAKSNDQLTKRALETGNEAFFQTANDDFTDNGKSLAAVIRTLGDGAQWHLLGQSISSAYKGSPGYTTTYLVGFWE